MSPERILVLDADSNAGLAVLQSLGAAGYACVTAAPDDTAPAFASRWARETAVYPNPLHDAEGFKRWIKAQLRADPVDLVIPCTESTLTPLDELRDDAEVVARTAMPSHQALATTLDKERLHALASALGISVPASRYLVRADELDEPSFDPWLGEGGVVVKTARSKTWAGDHAKEFPTIIARDRHELRRAVHERMPFVPVQVQQWVPGRGLGVELLARHGEIVMSVAHERLHEVPLTGGGSSYRRTIAMPPELYDAAARLMQALGYHGVAMVEFRGDRASGRHWLMEVNARFWGSLPLAIFAGADFPRALVRLLLHDERPSGPPPRAGVYARHLARDLRWLKLIVKHHGRFSPHELGAPLGTSLLQWTRILTGREVWDGLQLHDPRPVLREVRQLATRGAGAVAAKARALLVRRAAQRSSVQRARRYPSARRVLVLCHGNICRSPYAMQRLAALGGAGRELRSSGFYAHADRPPPEDFLRLTAQHGVDLRDHRSRVVDRDDLAWAELIVLMDQRNYDQLRALDRRSLRKAVWLGALDGEDLEIADPYGESDAAIDQVLSRIDRCAARLAREGA